MPHRFYFHPSIKLCRKMSVDCMVKCICEREVYILICTCGALMYKIQIHQWTLKWKMFWSVKLKVKFSMFFNWAPRHEGVLGEWRYSSIYSLTSALDGGEWSALRLRRFTPRERAPSTHWIGGWMGPWAILDAVVKRKMECMCWNYVCGTRKRMQCNPFLHEYSAHNEQITVYDLSSLAPPLVG
jgi:hypothetical protein